MSSHGRKISFDHTLIYLSLILAVFLAWSGSSYNAAKAQTCQNSLEDAVNAIGGAEATLEITPGTWAVYSDFNIPGNISLKFYKGGVIDVSSGATLTINGSIMAGSYRIFGGSGMIDMPAGQINAVWFTSGGSGTAASPWVGATGKAGIGEALDRTETVDVSKRSIFVPAGEYSATETISTRGLGANIFGRIPSLSSQEGSRVHIHFSPSSPKTLIEVNMLDGLPPDITDCFNSPFVTISWHTGVSGLYLTSNNPGGSGNIAVEAVDQSYSTFRDIIIDNWTGTGVQTRGRDTSTWERIKSKTQNPLIMKSNPYCTSIDMDSIYYRDLELIGTANTAGSAIVNLIPDCDPRTDFGGFDTSQFYFVGMQVWQGNQHGFVWDDPCNYGTDFNLGLSNVQSKNASPAGGYLFYLARNQHFFYTYFLANSDGSDRSGGFSYINLVHNHGLKSNSYHNSGYFLNSVGTNYGIEMTANSLGDSAKISAPGSTEAWSVKGGTRERLPAAVYLVSPN